MNFCHAVKGCDVLVTLHHNDSSDFTKKQLIEKYLLGVDFMLKWFE